MNYKTVTYLPAQYLDETRILVSFIQKNQYFNNGIYTG